MCLEEHLVAPPGVHQPPRVVCLTRAPALPVLRCSQLASANYNRPQLAKLENGRLRSRCRRMSHGYESASKSRPACLSRVWGSQGRAGGGTKVCRIPELGRDSTLSCRRQPGFNTFCPRSKPFLPRVNGLFPLRQEVTPLVARTSWKLSRFVAHRVEERERNPPG